jgi:hypothetical protein
MNMSIAMFGDENAEKSQADTTSTTETETDKTIESKISNVSRKKRTTNYMGLRKPRSNDPDLWALYNAVHGAGKREKRRRKTTSQAHKLYEDVPKELYDITYPDDKITSQAN